MTKRPLRPYQVEAINAITTGLADGGSGQLHAACGSGKTVMAMRAAEQLTGPDGLAVVLAPSLALVSQIIGDWFDESCIGYQAFAVCSDESIASDDEPVRVADLHAPVSTDPGEIAKWLAIEGPKLVVGTYLSAHRLAEAVRNAGVAVDLLICDEAHHLAGPADAPTRRIVDNSVLPARRRLYVTATPRIGGRSGGHRTLSMDDDVFGPVLYSYPFSRAIGEGYLSDYRIAVIGVTSDEVHALLNRGDLEFADGVGMRDAAAQVALARAYHEFGMRRAISFHPTVNEARRFVETLPRTLAALPESENIPAPTCLHANGAMPSAERRRVLRRLGELPEGGWAVASNARCLSEGVDVPAVDGILFAHAKHSVVDVVQATGRALRIHPDTPGPSTVIVPVILSATADGETPGEMDAGDFDTLISIVRALRDHDDVLAAELDQAKAATGPAGTPGGGPSKVVMVMPGGAPPSLLSKIRLLIVQRAGSARYAKWWAMFERAATYYRDAERLKRSIPKGDELGKWCSIQRTARRSGSLDALRIAALDGIGFAWSHTDEEQRYREFHLTHCRADRLACVPLSFLDAAPGPAVDCGCFTPESFLPLSPGDLGGVAVRQYVCGPCGRVWVERLGIRNAISRACARWVNASKSLTWTSRGAEQEFWEALRCTAPGLHESVMAARGDYARKAKMELDALLLLAPLLGPEDIDFLLTVYPEALHSVGSVEPSATAPSTATAASRAA